MPALFPSLPHLILRQTLRALIVWALIVVGLVLPVLARAERETECNAVCIAPLDRPPF